MVYDVIGGTASLFGRKCISIHRRFRNHYSQYSQFMKSMPCSSNTTLQSPDDSVFPADAIFTMLHIGWPVDLQCLELCHYS